LKKLEEEMLDLKYDLLCEVIADLEEPLTVGSTPQGIRIIFNIKGGTVKGKNISGDVLPTGADWIIIRPDGVGQLDVRATVRTEEGELIYVYYRGILNASPEVFTRIQSGEDVDPSEYYFRTTPVFETASDKYSWLNSIISVGVGKSMKNRVMYKIYQIL
jgi:hypothetical protein